MAKKKEKVNGKHCLQQAVWRNGGCTYVGQFLLFLHVGFFEASVCSPPLPQAAGR
jgi:hypothetical protein